MLAGLLAGGAGSVAAAVEQPDSCVTCHLATGDARLMRPVEAFRADIHAAVWPKNSNAPF
jgi:hypothetical protein